MYIYLHFTYLPKINDTNTVIKNRMLLQKLSYLIVLRYPAFQFLPILFDANIPFYKVHSIVVEAKSPLKLQFGF